MYESASKYNIQYRYLENNALIVWDKENFVTLAICIGFGDFCASQRNDACRLFFTNTVVGVSNKISILLSYQYSNYFSNKYSKAN